jgi:hypothetical protein
MSKNTIIEENGSISVWINNVTIVTSLWRFRIEGNIVANFY